MPCDRVLAVELVGPDEFEKAAVVFVHADLVPGVGARVSIGLWTSVAVPA